MAVSNKALLSLNFLATDHDPTNVRSLDRSRNSIHATFGDGATPATYPTKIAGQRGYTTAAGDYFQGATQGVFNVSEISICALFSPNYAANDGAQHYLYDTSVGAEIMVDKDAVNSLVFYAGGNVVITVLLANYQNYWFVNGYNTLVFRGRSGDNQAILNGYSIGTSATAWNAVNPAYYYIGCRYDATLFSTGNYYWHETYPFAMTLIQAADWRQRALRMINKV